MIGTLQSSCGSAAVDSLATVSARNWGRHGFRHVAGGECPEAWRKVFGLDPPKESH
jgi:hypothetical protein